MSRTAGLGSGDYVAINTVAVTALVFGLASSLVIMDLLFVVLPIVGIVLGIIAFRQVRKSNGTQTGGLMAILAIVFSVLFLGGTAGEAGLDALRQAADKAQVSDLIENFGKQIAAIDPANAADTATHLGSAYDLFDENFRGRVPRAEFDRMWEESFSLYGPIVSVQSNGLLKLETETRSGDLMCSGIALGDYKRSNGLARWVMVFRKLNGKWYIENLPELFPPPSSAQGSRRNG